MRETSSNPNDKGTPTGAETYSSAMVNAHNYIAWLLDSFGDDLAAPVLEIGVGHGSYAHLLQRRGAYVGIDVDLRSVELARLRFPQLRFEHVDITHGSFANLLGTQFRSIVCFNVLEHIAEHEQALTNLSKVLLPGGKLLIIVPALPMLYNELDRMAGHLRRYRLQEISSLLTQSGLVPERVEYLNPVGGLGWWANSLTKPRSLNDRSVNAQIALFDKWAIPLSRSLNLLTRRFFGQSIIAVGKNGDSNGHWGAAPQQN